jgi:hypothetical protein
MTDPINSPSAQLPAVQAATQQSSTALSPANPAALPQTGVTQEALSVLMNTSLSPYQMASQFATIKESYLKRTYGITIE